MPLIFSISAIHLWNPSTSLHPFLGIKPLNSWVESEPWSNLLTSFWCLWRLLCTKLPNRFPREDRFLQNPIGDLLLLQRPPAQKVGKRWWCFVINLRFIFGIYSRTKELLFCMNWARSTKTMHNFPIRNFMCNCFFVLFFFSYLLYHNELNSEFSTINQSNVYGRRIWIYSFYFLSYVGISIYIHVLIISSKYK